MYDEDYELEKRVDELTDKALDLAETKMPVWFNNAIVDRRVLIVLEEYARDLAKEELKRERDDNDLEYRLSQLESKANEEAMYGWQGV